eukprot:s325_g27.t1
MPPKPKAKAKGLPLKRPAALRDRRKKPGKEPEEISQELALREGEKTFAASRLQDLLRLGPIVMQSAIYYGRTVHVAGKLVDVRSESGELYGILKASGTKDEELLRILAGRQPRHLRVHLCDEACSQQVTAEDRVRSRTYELVDLQRLPWLRCLEGATEAMEDPDELAKLREEKEKRERDLTPVREGKEKKKKKRKKEARREEEGREAKSPKEAKEGREPGQKDLAALFSGTGMDPDAKERRKWIKKARKLGRKKGKKRRRRDETSSSGSEGSSSSTSSSDDSHAAGLFDEELRLKLIWKKCPGVLTARALTEARGSLVTSAGTVWDLDKSSMPPLFLHYARSQLMPLMGPVVQQEVLTLSTTLDLLVQGNVTRGMDVLAQRVKALEAIA